jgi:hypothetical protein
MKKIIITTMFLLSVFFNKAQEITYNHEIHCTPSIEKCLENLEKLKDFLEYDYSMSNDIPKYVYNEYNLVIDYTMLSLKMILKDEAQCIESEVVEEINFRD